MPKLTKFLLRLQTTVVVALVLVLADRRYSSRTICANFILTIAQSCIIASIANAMDEDEELIYVNVLSLGFLVLTLSKQNGIKIWQN